MKAGFLPLYTALYDKPGSVLRIRLGEFYDKLTAMLRERGDDVVTNEICTVKNEFEAAVKKFEDENCEAIFTIHLAYSPSLESYEALINTKLPIIVIDTTDTEDFSDNSSPKNISYCHGIHGVMDMCNMLKKNNKLYAIAAGYYEDGAVIDKAVGLLKAAVSANSVKGSKVGSIGGYFNGMGDFQIEDAKLKELYDVEVVYPKEGELASITAQITDEEVAAEKERNTKDFKFIGEIDEKIYNDSVKNDLTIKKWIENNNLNALTINFLEIGSLVTMPFNACCRAMESGIGYAGEGDKFTAMFVGGLLKGYKETSFIEIFCPDWKNNTLFISHMGEINYAVADNTPTAFEKKFAYGNQNSVAASASFKEGDAVYLNAFVDAKGVNLLISPVKVVKETTDNFINSVRGWLDFGKPIDEVLTVIGEYGVTHHSMLVYDTNVTEMKFFADCLGLNPIIYKQSQYLIKEYTDEKKNQNTLF